EEAGGRVDFLLGNHEIMVVQGDLRYVNPKYEESASLLNTGISQLYGIDTEIGQWLRTRNTILKIDNLLFVHGGIHPELINADISWIELNPLIRDNIDKTRDDRSIDPFVEWVFGSRGPFWYRGYSREQKAYGLIDSVSVDKLLSHFKVDHIITGHTTVEEIQTLFNGKIIQIDAGIKNGIRGEALLYQQNRFFRISESGRRIPLF
ncbi:MAG: metallophosphoesterase, partial [Calditrichaeota bacterium]